MSRPMAMEIDALVRSNEQVGSQCWELAIQSRELSDAALPGHFVHLSYPSQAATWMRRPFSIYRVRSDDGIVSLLYICRGEFTRGLSHVHPGDSLSIVGPLGNSFAPVVSPVTDHVLVAGGIGAPPMAFLATHLSASGHAGRTTIINGARTADLLVASGMFAASGAIYIETTDDGTQGRRGLVTDVLSELVQGKAGAVTVYACGPTPMLRAVAGVCQAHEVTCYVSLETVMPCGVGVCMGCAVKLRDAESPAGYSYVRSCHEGPVFAASSLVWD